MSKLTFEPIPSISADQALAIVDYIHKRYINPRLAGSYGAFLVRNTTAELAEACIARFGALNHRTEKYKHAGFGGNTPYIHADYGKVNDLTTHITRKGSAEVAVLLTAVAPKQGPDLKEGLADKLLDKALYLGTETVTRSFRAVVGQGDMLLFDHTQLHVFRGNDTQRVSTGYYYLAKP